MSRPRLLDLFCGAGGAARGYQLAGFHVTGVDIAPQPNYAGDEFVQADALAYPLGGFDAIHASPPCQAFTRARVIWGNEHPDMVPQTRALLVGSGLPYVIENVVGAPLIDALVLCGTGFGLRHDGFELRRHRLFESNVFMMAPGCCHSLPAAPVFGHNPGGEWMQRHGRGYDLPHRRAVMGIDWMNRDEIAEAIPPVFTEHVGGYLMAAVSARAAA